MKHIYWKTIFNIVLFKFLYVQTKSQHLILNVQAGDKNGSTSQKYEPFSYLQTCK